MNNKEINISTILKELFSDDLLKKQYVNEIRRYSIIGDLTNKILEENGLDERCKVLAIGDIKYFGDLNNSWEKIVDNSLKSINAKNLLGYDLSGLGSLELRESLFSYMNKYYSFNDDILDKDIVNKIIPVYGATDGFTLMLDSIKNIYQDKNINFIYPEASFLANIKIAENILGKENLIKINKASNKDFFITDKQISRINKSKDIINIYYITAVGNPTGEKLDNDKIYNILSTIYEEDENGIIILDNVYVGLLNNNESNNMFSKIFSNENLLSKIIFLESLSKTLGTTGIRLGWIWSLNTYLNEKIKIDSILKKAGFSKLLGEFCIKIFSNMEEILSFQENAYSFFSKQRLGFLDYMKKNHSIFFDFDSMPKVLDREGIYILLKIKNNYDIEEIFVKTGIIGVKIELSDGIYIRYAFGNVNYF